MGHFTSAIALIGIVIIVASLLSGVIERSGVPIVAVFLALGALLGPLGLGLIDVQFDTPALRVLATLGLALVLFSDAVTFDRRQLRERRGLLWRLLGPGTLVPALLTAIAAWLLLDIPALAAAILGAALASTDPVLLRTVLRSRALPETPRMALRIESGMNDIVLLPIVVLAMLFLHVGTTPEAVAGTTIARAALGLFVLGPLFGAMVGWIGISALVWVRSHMGVRRDYESLYALGLAFSAFAAAESVGGSGFVAAFAAGLMIAVNDVELCDCFREYGEATAEMLLLFTFVALGVSLIWTGLPLIGWRTLAFAAIALTIRTVVLYPVLRRAGLSLRDRRLIAMFGPRGLSSLLLLLLPVFAGIPGAQRLFSIACIVVLFSVVLHGGATALFLRHTALAQRAAERRAAAQQVASAASAASAANGLAPDASDAAPPSDRITIGEMRRLQELGEPVVIVDARAERSYHADQLIAAGAVRVDPDDPVRDATARRLSQHATLVIYCA